ncbi:unnamed protein product [Gadus morhua 'NCC']
MDVPSPLEPHDPPDLMGLKGALPGLSYSSRPPSAPLSDRSLPAGWARSEQTASRLARRENEGFGMKEQHVSSSEMDENICMELHRERGVSSGHPSPSTTPSPPDQRLRPVGSTRATATLKTCVSQKWGLGGVIGLKVHRRLNSALKCREEPGGEWCFETLRPWGGRGVSTVESSSHDQPVKGTHTEFEKCSQVNSAAASNTSHGLVTGHAHTHPRCNPPAELKVADVWASQSSYRRKPGGNTPVPPASPGPLSPCIARPSPLSSVRSRGSRQSAEYISLKSLALSTASHSNCNSPPQAFVPSSDSPEHMQQESRHVPIPLNPHDPLTLRHISHLSGKAGRLPRSQLLIPRPRPLLPSDRSPTSLVRLGAMADGPLGSSVFDA